MCWTQIKRPRGKSLEIICTGQEILILFRQKLNGFVCVKLVSLFGFFDFFITHCASSRTIVVWSSPRLSYSKCALLDLNFI